MASNHKLTGVLKGRKITSTQSQGNELRISFNDGSTMIVQTGGTVSSAATGGTVKAVRQEGTRLNLDFEEGGTVEIETAEPTASVMVRDKVHSLEYAD
jgi:frataxin-like iron-binding protein CyaY